MVSRLAYRDQSRAYLEQANEELARDDLRQASEKGWGAASQIVKLWPKNAVGNIGDIGSYTMRSPCWLMKQATRI